MIEDEERCWRAAQSKDQRFDGWFYTAVITTGIYCRPSCPATTPKRANVRFYPTAAAAQQAGFRACKRCRPDATPGSPEWNARADLVGRAMRLIADGVVDRDGVPGLAERLGYSERQVHRQLVAEVGAGPLALARAQRARMARLLIETTDLPFAEVAFGAGFSSIRQFNDTVLEVFASTPTELRAAGRRRATGSPSTPPGWLTLRLPVRPPFDGAAVIAFLGARAVAGVEEVQGDTYRRSVQLPGGMGIVELTATPDHVRCALRLDALSDLAAAVGRCRRLLDLDADPVAVDEQLSAEPLLAPLVAKRPGLRCPGTVDGNELAVRAVLGQQVSVAGARTAAARLVAGWGEPLADPTGGVTHLFPTPESLISAPDEALAGPRARLRALRTLATTLASGAITLDPGGDRVRTAGQLVSLPGIGPWTAGYISMRALGDPDVFLPTDLGVRHALSALGAPNDPRSASRFADGLRPWRSSALHHLWASLPTPGPHPPLPGQTRNRTPRPTTTRVKPGKEDAPVTSTTTPAPVHGRLFARRIDTPIGRLTLVGSKAGLRAVLWADEMLPGRPGLADALDVDAADGSRLAGPSDRAAIDAAATQLTEYFAGARTTFDVPLDLHGTDFQVAAWQALATVPYATTTSYADQAARIGRPKATRAIGGANGRNPVPIVLPCHRIIGRDGSLTGFGGGLDTKRYLLDFERATSGDQPQRRNPPSLSST